MGSWSPVRETILEVGIISFIFKGIETKDAANINKLSDKIAQLQKMHCLYTKDTPIALIKKVEAEIAILQCKTGEKPGIIAECGVDLNANCVMQVSKSIGFLCVKGFSSVFAQDWSDVAKASLIKTLKPIGIDLANSKIFSQEEREKFKDEHVCAAYPWDAFEEAYIPQKILALINSLSANPFVYKIMLASLLPDSTETLLLTQCADDHCRIAAHWGPEPLSFRINGLHPKQNS